MKVVSGVCGKGGVVISKSNDGVDVDSMTSFVEAAGGLGQ